jgi:hypothetical protein
MRVEGGESIQADCDCWTDSEPPSLARSPLARQASWPIPQSSLDLSRLLHPRIVEGLSSLSLLVVCKSVLPNRGSGNEWFPTSRKSGDSWQLAVSHESTSAAVLASFRLAGPLASRRVVPAYKSLSPRLPSSSCSKHLPIYNPFNSSKNPEQPSVNTVSHSLHPSCYRRCRSTCCSCR